MKTYDVIVIGMGGIGSAALAAVARRDVKVLGLDQFPPAHDRGSSHGATRIIRKAYFEHPDYVPLVTHAYQRWRELEVETGRSLLSSCGLIQVGPESGEVIRGVLQSAQDYQLDAEALSHQQLVERFPQFDIPENVVGAWEPDAGYLRVESCVEAHLDVARNRGAICEHEATVTGFQFNGRTVIVSTALGDFEAPKVIVTPGPWAPQMLSDLPVEFKILRKHLHWLKSQQVFQEDAGFPAFLFEMPDGVFYGFPAIDHRGLKVAQHSGGEIIDDPKNASRDIDQAELESVRGFTTKCMPRLGFETTSHVVCFYTMAPDGHFVVGRHPAHEQVLVAAGLSGHGFKFAPAIGDALAELALDGRSSLSIEFLSPDRLLRS